MLLLLLVLVLLLVWPEHNLKMERSRAGDRLLKWTREVEEEVEE